MAADDSPVVAGFAWPEAEQRLAGSLLVGTESRGKGSVVLFVQDPAYRLFWRARRRSSSTPCSTVRARGWGAGSKPSPPRPSSPGPPPTLPGEEGGPLRGCLSPRQPTRRDVPDRNDTLRRPRGRRDVSSKGLPLRRPKPSRGQTSLPRSDLVLDAVVAPAETSRRPRGLRKGVVDGL